MHEEIIIRKIREGFLDILEDIRDTYLAEQRLEDIRSGFTQTIPLKEVMKKYGMEENSEKYSSIGKKCTIRGRDFHYNEVKIISRDEKFLFFEPKDDKESVHAVRIADIISLACDK